MRCSIQCTNNLRASQTKLSRRNCNRVVRVECEVDARISACPVSVFKSYRSFLSSVVEHLSKPRSQLTRSMETQCTHTLQRLSEESSYIDFQSSEKREEFAFYIAEDSAWLDTHTEAALASILGYSTKTNQKEAMTRTPLQEIRNMQAMDMGSCHVPDSLQIPQCLKGAERNPQAITALNDQSDPASSETLASGVPVCVAVDTVPYQSSSIPPAETLLKLPDGHKRIEGHDSVSPDLAIEMSLEECFEAPIQGKTPPVLPAIVEAIAFPINTTMLATQELQSDTSLGSADHDGASEAAVAEPVADLVPIIGESPPEIQTHAQQAVAQDYMEPINLDSPAKRDDSRTESAYFSAPQSPEAGLLTRSPRPSIAFASLPVRQPFAKKSLGARTSQNRSSVFDAAKAEMKTPRSTCLSEVFIKPEPQSTPVLDKDVIACEEMDNLRNAMTVLTTPGSKHVKQENPGVQTSSPVNNSQESDTAVPQPAYQATPIKDCSRVATVVPEEEEWLPRLDVIMASPKKTDEPVAVVSQDLPPVQSSQAVTSNERVAPSPTKRSLNDEPLTEKHATGPLRAAMQAASAKATSYLRQARTAFGSPAMNHTKVFPSTTPKYSLTKLQPKVEPRTPSLYPKVETIQPSGKPTMIPSKTPRKDILTELKEQDTPRRSPRRTPKKGVEASQSMAIMAARSATRVVSSKKDRHEEKGEEKDSLASPRKGLKLLSKFPVQQKAKPLSIRVATASQRELDHSKDRKTQGVSIPGQTSSVGVSMPRSGSENSQLDALNKSQSGASNRAGPSRQIKALAAATQAKEKAERVQERRDRQRREIEQKRQEAKRLADEEEKRKTEQQEEQNRKRKATTESKTVSAKKQQLRPMQSKESLQERPSADKVLEPSKIAHQSLKRPLAEIEEPTKSTTATAPQEQRRRCTDDQVEVIPIQKEPAAKPVRVSLQKKSLFGQPGEPGYKKPSAQPFNKGGPIVDVVKYSNDHVRFAGGSTTTSTSVVSVDKAVNLPPSELIELPEINSDYSDSDDDDLPVKADAFKYPAWAESPELRQRLRDQEHIDPEGIFGIMQPLQMEEMFKGKERALARFRPRSSSANWFGNDKLSADEVVEYARVMGFKT